jgi:hypothetical protein
LPSLRTRPSSCLAYVDHPYEMEFRTTLLSYIVTARPNLTCYILFVLNFIVFMILFFVTRAYFWAWRPKTRMTSQQSALLIKPVTTLLSVDVRYYNPSSLRSTTGQPVRSALIPNVIARPNLPYIVRFGSYRLHGFVPGDTSSLLSLTLQNTYDKLVTGILNKINYHFLTVRLRYYIYH